MKHSFTITSPAQKVPSRAFSDGAVTGNGDLSLVWGGTADRVRLYLGKCDFWKADGNAYHPVWGGVAPVGVVELLLPEFAHSPYRVEQDPDRARLTEYFEYKSFNATLSVIVCSEENTVLLELDSSFPGISASAALLPLEGNGAITECRTEGDLQYTVRGFDSEDLRFPSYAMSVLRKVGSVRTGDRVRTRWVVCVSTNHDTAAYRLDAKERACAVDDVDFDRKAEIHARWWRDFWSKSGVTLADADLEKHWYMGIYAMACCARNKKFPPGLWGTFGTADGQRWFCDYHLNYNHQSPFYPLTTVNHPELTDCYLSPILDFLPKAKRYAREYLGCRGAYYPVALGPLGMETDVRSETKEHGHLFLGQKSNGAYCAVIPMMRWYATRDPEYGKAVYPFLRELGDFWEDYLVFEDGRYVIYNDNLHETLWWSGADYVSPEGEFDQVNVILSLGLVRALMALLLDLSKALGIDADRCEKWQHILDHLSEIKTAEADGVPVLLESDDPIWKRDILSLRSVFPAGYIGKYRTPALYNAAKNTLEKLRDNWSDGGLGCEYFVTAARLDYPAEALIGHMRDCIKNHQLPNGLFEFGGGGIENCASIPGGICEMLLQSSEGILRLFPCWDRTLDASFHGLRAYGAFVVKGEMKSGKITAEIVSERGEPLSLERPAENCVVLYRGERIPLTEQITVFETDAGERLSLIQE